MRGVLLPILTAAVVYGLPANSMETLAKSVMTWVKMTTTTTNYSGQESAVVSNFAAAYTGVTNVTIIKTEPVRPEEPRDTNRIFYIQYDTWTQAEIPDDYTVTGKVVPEVVPVQEPAPEPCNHNFQEVVISEASETEDGVIALQCVNCKMISKCITAAGSAANVFMKDAISRIKNAPENGYCGLRHLDQMLGGSLISDGQR